MEQEYRQCKLRGLGPDASIKICWIPLELARVDNIIITSGDIGTDCTWLVCEVYPQKVTFELLTNIRDARKDRASTLK